MNVLFFLTPKSQIKYVDSSMSIRQVLEVIEHYRFTTIPLLSKDGKFIGTITEGDLLFYVKDHPFKSISEFNNVNILEVKRHRDYLPINSNHDMVDLIVTAVNENFVPVLDDLGYFIGIVTRKSIINYLYLENKKQANQ